MKYIYVLVLSVISCGCVWTRETSEVIVHRNTEGVITGVDYIERREQQDMKPWAEFGGYLNEYGKKKIR